MLRGGPHGSRRTLKPIATHYETLGVAPDATQSQIRGAYLARARRHHPDVGGGDAGGDSMAGLSRAYEVLRNVERRREYDRRLALGAVPDRSTDPGVEQSDGSEPIVAAPSPHGAGRVLTPPGPARMPWRLMAVTAVVGSIVVVASAALNDSPSVEPPDGILRVGSCVVIEPNLDVREVACRSDDDVVVRLMVPTGATCPPQYATYRDRLGLGMACVDPVE